jgi:hypothetical protein
VRIRFVSMIALTAFTFGVRAASAGCPATCAITVNPASSVPALPTCATWELPGEECDCGVLATFNNACALAFQAVVPAATDPRSGP